jgi:hypothetical protein
MMASTSRAHHAVGPTDRRTSSAASRRQRRPRLRQPGIPSSNCTT